MPRHLCARHRQQEARIDPVATRVDAVAGERATARPGFRRRRAVAGTHNGEYAGDHFRGRGADARRAGHRTGLDAFAAARAGVEHRLRARGNGRFESHGHGGGLHEIILGNGADIRVFRNGKQFGTWPQCLSQRRWRWTVRLQISSHVQRSCRALRKLRVAANWFAPVERNANEAAWFEVVRAFLPDAVPKVLAAEAQAGVFAMEYLPGGAFPN